MRYINTLKTSLFNPPSDQVFANRRGMKPINRIADRESNYENHGSGARQGWKTWTLLCPIFIRRETRRKAIMMFDPQADRRKNFAMTSNNLGQGRVQFSTWDNADDREGAKQRWLDMISPSEPAWIFAYGSLMWDPGFVFEAVEPATIFGYHRRFCIYSHIYRGTPAASGSCFRFGSGALVGPGFSNCAVRRPRSARDGLGP